MASKTLQGLDSAYHKSTFLCFSPSCLLMEIHPQQFYHSSWNLSDSFLIQDISSSSYLCFTPDSRSLCCPPGLGQAFSFVSYYNTLHFSFVALFQKYLLNYAINELLKTFYLFSNPPKCRFHKNRGCMSIVLYIITSDQKMALQKRYSIILVARIWGCHCQVLCICQLRDSGINLARLQEPIYVTTDGLSVQHILREISFFVRCCERGKNAVLTE